jgi:hypothetical protein
MSNGSPTDVSQQHIIRGPNGSKCLWASRQWPTATWRCKLATLQAHDTASIATRDTVSIATHNTASVTTCNATSLRWRCKFVATPQLRGYKLAMTLQFVSLLDSNGGRCYTTQQWWRAVQEKFLCVCVFFYSATSRVFNRLLYVPKREWERKRERALKLVWSRFF